MQLRSDTFVGEKAGTLQDKWFHSKRAPVSQADELRTINGFSISVVSLSSHSSHICPSQLLPLTVFSRSIESLWSELLEVHSH